MKTLHFIALISATILLGIIAYVFLSTKPCECSYPDHILINNEEHPFPANIDHSEPIIINVYARNDSAFIQPYFSIKEDGAN